MEVVRKIKIGVHGAARFLGFSRPLLPSADNITERTYENITECHRVLGNITKYSVIITEYLVILPSTTEFKKILPSDTVILPSDSVILPSITELTRFQSFPGSCCKCLDDFIGIVRYSEFRSTLGKWFMRQLYLLEKLGYCLHLRRNTLKVQH